MLTHYLATALRHFRRHKVTTAINVVCLAIGLLCFLLVYGITLSLKTSDMRFPNADRIVALTQQVTVPGAASAFPDTPTVALSAGNYLRLDFPELEVVARESFSIEVPLAYGESAIRAQARYVDPEWFELFSVPFVAGNPHHPCAARAVSC